MIHPEGLVSHRAFQGAGGKPLIDTSYLVYDGNSQGAVLGGTATAVAQDWTRAVLGVPGMNYSLFLRRSADYIEHRIQLLGLKVPTFQQILDRSYPDEVDRPLLLALVQMLWDRAELKGHARRLISDPYPDTPRHDHPRVEPVLADVPAGGENIRFDLADHPLAPGVIAHLRLRGGRLAGERIRPRRLRRSKSGGSQRPGEASLSSSRTSSVIRRALLLRHLQGQHRTGRRPHHLLGHAAQKQVLETAQTVGGDDDQIDVGARRVLDNGGRRSALEDSDLAGHFGAFGLAHEARHSFLHLDRDLGKGILLTGIMEYVVVVGKDR